MENDTFGLVVKQLEYDVTVVENWKIKRQGAKASRERAKHEFRLDRINQAEGMGTNFLNACVKMSVWGTKSQRTTSHRLWVGGATVLPRSLEFRLALRQHCFG